MRLIDLLKKSKLCDNCANLQSKTGREYRCLDGHARGQYFKKTPTYCINFKPRKDGNNESNP